MQDLSSTNIDNLQGHWNKFAEAAIEFAPRIATAVLSAIIILLIGLWVISLIRRLTNKIFEKRNLDRSLRTFLSNLINWTLKILLFIVVVSQLGVQTSAFIALIGAGGLAIGLALQGSLANFAGGVLILTLRPFRVGDFISTSSGTSGSVVAIDIFSTKLNTPQNQRIVIPNGELSNSSITNFTALGTRRTWFDIGVSYGANLKEAKEILTKVVTNNEFAFKEPAPQIMVTELGDSAVNLSVRVTTSNENFWVMHEQLIIDCKEALDKAGIEIPFPQRDVHVYSKS
ncbi:mechanosensitive ion channel family protein [Parapedobacter tibetensis]|uniref:mechanosensitive ion channel family protein n=1 Tax=Parapedobacter tibetensis TaxID=2972951 RepID=UPI00214D4F7A|nr:mechanosensitive ion channel family protein [Parapedobacter tibetensis]